MSNKILIFLNICQGFSAIYAFFKKGIKAD
jgi:hypothetical protein